MATTWITGICIQQNRLEWTVLRRAKEAWEVSSRGQAELPAVDGAPDGLTAAALKPHLRHFRGKIAVALPTGRVLLRMALLPSTDAAELRGMTELQTDKFSPFPVETVAAGAEVLEAAGTSSLVAMAVVRRDDVEALGRAFQGAGVLPDGVDVEALGWWWGLKQSGQVPALGSQIILRATAAGIDMVVARDGAPLLFRTLPRQPAAGAAAEWADECAEEVADSLTALETEWGGAGTPTLHVFHAADVPVECAARLQQALGLADVFTHPLEDLPAAAEGVARRAAAPAPVLAMDLTPEAWRAADAARQTRRRLLRSATVFLALWLAALGLFWTLLNLQRGRMARLEREVAEMEAPALEIRRLRAKVQEFTQYADRSRSALECLRVVSAALPAGMDLTSFIYRKGSSLTLRGEADVPDKVYAFNQAMEQTGLFPEVKPEGVTTRSTPQGTRSQYSVVLVLPGEGGEAAP